MTEERRGFRILFRFHCFFRCLGSFAQPMLSISSRGHSVSLSKKRRRIGANHCHVPMSACGPSTGWYVVTVPRWGRFFIGDQPFRWFLLIGANHNIPLVRIPEECWSQVHRYLEPAEQIAVVAIDRFHYGMHRYNLGVLDKDYWPNPVEKVLFHSL